MNVGEQVPATQKVERLRDREEGARARATMSGRLLYATHTDKNENQIFLIYKEIQSGAVAKSYMRKGFPIHTYEEMRKYFPI
jgi:hypothetical protein